MPKVNENKKKGGKVLLGFAERIRTNHGPLTMDKE